MHLVRRNSEIKVGTEMPCLNLLGQVTIGCAHHTATKRPILAASDPAKSPGLNGAEKLSLDRQIQFTDLVQKEHPSPNLFEITYVIPFGIGEGSLFVAEKLAFQQGRLDGSHIDRDPWLVASVTQIVNSLRNQFLARPTLAY